DTYGLPISYGGCSFFFQAEDGIRDRNVTGVQTCALPIFEIDEGAQAPSDDELLDGTEFLIARTLGGLDGAVRLVARWDGGSGVEIGRASCRGRGWMSARAAACRAKDQSVVSDENS